MPLASLSSALESQFNFKQQPKIYCTAILLLLNDVDFGQKHNIMNILPNTGRSVSVCFMVITEEILSQFYHLEFDIHVVWYIYCYINKDNPYSNYILLNYALKINKAAGL